MKHKELLWLLEGSAISDIEVCEPRSVDDNAWFIYIRLKGGKELRAAVSSEEEARSDCAYILRCRDHPAIIPQTENQQANSARVPLTLFWITLTIVTLFLACHGAMNYWLVKGWVYTSHFVSGLLLSMVLFRLFWASVSDHPFQMKFYLMATPLLVLMTAALTSAGKTINAKLGSPERIHIRGPIINVEDDTQNLLLGGRGHALHRVQIPQSVITVQDESSGNRYTIDVPGRVIMGQGIVRGQLWEDEFYRGCLGWLYRHGTVWENQEFVPRIVPPR